MSLLSILIATVPNRREQLDALFNDLSSQAQAYGDDVEVLVLLDNKKRSIGLKRQALFDIAKGIYVTWIDDDDKVAPDYVDRAMEVINGSFHPDVITLKQYVYIDGNGAYELTFKAGHEVNEEIGETPATRPPWHVCIWKRETVKGVKFPDSMYGEDWAWAEQANKLIRHAKHIDHFMLTYIFDSNITEATNEELLTE